MRQEEGDEPPVIRGLWVQEIDWLKTVSSTGIIPPPPEFSDSVPYCHGDHLQACLYRGCTCTGDGVWRSEEVSPCRLMDADDTSSTDGRVSDSECASFNTHESESDSSGCSDADTQHQFGADVMSQSALHLMHVSGFTSPHHTDMDSDSTGCAQSQLGISDSTCTLSSVNASQKGFRDDTTGSLFDERKGRVTQVSKLFISPSFRESIKQMLSDWKTTKAASEGLIFHHVRLFHQFVIWFP